MVVRGLPRKLTKIVFFVTKGGGATVLQLNWYSTSCDDPTDDQTGDGPNNYGMVLYDTGRRLTTPAGNLLPSRKLIALQTNSGIGIVLDMAPISFCSRLAFCSVSSVSAVQIQNK